MKNTEISWLDASRLQPSQFYINEAKLKILRMNFDPALCDPVPVKELDGQLVMTDGHTRACFMILEGYRSIPVIRETADLNWQAYRINVRDCRKRGIRSALDLPRCIVPSDIFEENWNTYCDRVQSSLAQKQPDLQKG